MIDLLSSLNMGEIKAKIADMTLSSLKNDVEKILTMLGPENNDFDEIKTAFKKLLERLDDLPMQDSSHIIVTANYCCVYYAGSFLSIFQAIVLLLPVFMASGHKIDSFFLPLLLNVQWALIFATFNKNAKHRELIEL